MGPKQCEHPRRMSLGGQQIEVIKKLLDIGLWDTNAVAFERREPSALTKTVFIRCCDGAAVRKKVANAQHNPRCILSCIELSLISVFDLDITEMTFEEKEPELSCPDGTKLAPFWQNVKYFIDTYKPLQVTHLDSHHISDSNDRLGIHSFHYRGSM